MSKKLTTSERIAAWKQPSMPAFDGLSQFQYDAWGEIRKIFPELDLAISGESEFYLSAIIPGKGIKVFIYLDQAEVNGNGVYFSGEWQDYDSPEELIKKFVLFLKDAAAV